MDSVWFARNAKTPAPTGVSKGQGGEDPVTDRNDRLDFSCP
jgi:hypothetical protein